MVTADEGIRETSLEALGGLNPVPGQEIHTAGSSSQVSDGAAVVILANQNAIDKYGLTPRARIVATTLVGVDPVTMLKGPIPASRKVLDQAGLSVDDVDVFEVNEAFACVAMFTMRDIGIDHAKINVNGGATALGHPIGASGTRIIVTLINALKTQGKKRGVASLCIGGGEATAVAVELV